MKIIPARILDGVFKLQRPCYKDSRGYFIETFKRSEFAAVTDQLGPVEILQTNVSFSKAGVIRGLHFQQAPYAQGKIVTCLQGSILDIVLDLRPYSKTLGQWESFVLEDVSSALFIPPGFAHGFETLGPQNLVQYAVFNAEYALAYEAGIYYADTELKLPWQNTSPEISEKDLLWPTYKNWIKSSVF